MTFHIYGKNLDITPSMKEYAESKLERLSKYGMTILDAKVEVDVNKHHQHGDIFHVSVKIDIPHDMIYTEEQAPTFYAALDSVINELEQQFRTKKGKFFGKRRRIFETRRLLKAFQPWTWRRGK